MEPTLPTIEDLHDRLAKLTLDGYVDDSPSFFEVQRVHAQAMLLIALELEQINNNLEALRRGDKS